MRPDTESPLLKGRVRMWGLESSNQGSTLVPFAHVLPGRHVASPRAPVTSSGSQQPPVGTVGVNGSTTLAALREVTNCHRSFPPQQFSA